MLVLDTILHHRSPELMKVMRAKYDPKRYDYVRDADELMHFAKLIELGSRLVGHEVVAAHVDTKRQYTKRVSAAAGRVTSCPTARKSRV